LSLRKPHPAWIAVAAANAVGLVLPLRLETLPFEVLCVVVALLFAFDVKGLRSTPPVLASMVAMTGLLLAHDLLGGTEFWGELLEIPLFAGLLIGLVVYAHRTQAALDRIERLAHERAQLLEHQEQLLHDVSHELRTPVTIARGHLEMLARAANGSGSAEATVAIDELDRITHIVDQLLLLAKAEEPNFAQAADLELEPFLEDVFLRWSEVAQRVWRLGPVPVGTLRADPQRLRIALDALLENAVEHTTSSETVELAARDLGGELAIDVGDGGSGIPAEALDRIFERFGRADASRSRREGGVGLGLPIVDAIARAHGGYCAVTTSPKGSTFTLHLPGFTPAQPVTPRPGHRLAGNRDRR
jgi:signal transduction histidine kinase